MKINLREKLARKLGLAAVSGAMMLPGAANAESLDTNLVANPGFEDVDTLTGGSYGSLLINNWQGNGFAYAYSQNYDNRAGGVMPPDAGAYYFNGGNSNDGGLPMWQDVDVSTGDTGAAIGAGQAVYNLSAFFSSYLANGDFGNVTAKFLDGSGTELGAVTISDSDTTQWTTEEASGTVPVGTATVRIESQGTPLSGQPDGYVDLVDFQISQIPEPGTLALAMIGLAGGGVLALRIRRRE